MNVANQATIRFGNPWLPARRPRVGIRVRLFAFPYAGGDASIYSPWFEDVPPEIELLPVQLPGRGRRAMEPAISGLGPLRAALADGLATALEPPYALFGHSFGALIAFELARELRRRRRPGPCHLLVSAHPGPRAPRRYPPLSPLPDLDFLEQLYQRYGYATPEDDEQLDELLEVMLPTIRSDVRLSDAYAYAPEPALDCPITAFGGLDDETVTRDELAAWKDETTGAFATRMLPGGHFFLAPAQTFLIRFIADILRGSLR